MSEALDYLLKARPEAMASYFRFMKAAGTHLDPKTRALLSVITKVAAQTEAGFRQYLTRALKAGVSANEVIDGLLMCFPMLGLTKITWAMDQLLEMDIPEFRLEALEQVPLWHDVIALEEVPDRGTVRVACDDRELFVHRGEAGLQAYDSRCPHQVTNIPELALTGGRLTCPKHGWVFDMADGRCVEKGDRPLRQFPVKVENGRLHAYW